MSGTRRTRDNIAPTLFPFLAVLLCTMGALVLILMLIVAGAQASTKEAEKANVERAEEAEATLELASEAYEKKLEEGRLAIEKKRLRLQQLEDHIEELTEQLDELEKTSQLVEVKADTESEAEKSREEELSELEKQLADAKQKLEKKLDDPKGNKPIFAIIPYEGTNGTHRRPIYLECHADGITIQPEGIELSTADLQPPHGPGNPLDAALRAIRQEYRPNGGSLTSNAYPLLVVRPNGIRSYVLARAAMSGWDDQFGYELVGESLELTFPESTPGLKDKLARTISVARERQAALVMAMPRKYQNQIGNRNLSALREANGTQGASSGGASAGVTSSGGGSSRRTLEFGGNASGRGGFSFSEGAIDAASSVGAPFENSTQNSFSQNSGAALGFAQGGTGDQFESLGGSSAQNGALPTGRDWNTAANESGNPSLSGDYVAGGSGGNGGSDYGKIGGSQSQTGTSFFGSSGASAGAAAANGSIASGLNNGTGGAPGSNTSSPGGLSSGGSSGNTAANSGASGGGSSSSNSSSSSSGGSAGNAMNMSGSSIELPSFGTPGSMASNATAANGSSSGQASNSDSASGSQSNTQPGNASGGNASGGESSSPPAGSAGNTMRSISSGTPGGSGSSGQRGSESMGSGGRTWSWSQGPANQTAVVRSIRVRCEEDRWIIFGDAESKTPFEIPFDGTPQQRAEKLARHVAGRVEGWGLAIMGGYWKPILTVEVAPGAEWRYEQLERLLDGSGLDVKRRE